MSYRDDEQLHHQQNMYMYTCITTEHVHVYMYNKSYHKSTQFAFIEDKNNMLIRIGGKNNKIVDKIGSNVL